MEITKENIDALNGVLTVTVHPEDYREKVEGILEEYRKQVKMPGFRPGKVPIQLVRKQYGKAVLADELNKILGERLDGYIRHRQNQIDVAVQLFEAMGIERDDKEKRMDWMLRGFRQFDAPVSLVLTYDKTMELPMSKL